MKFLLKAIALILIVCFLIVAGAVIWWQHNGENIKKDLKETGQTARKEGEEFGKNAEQKDCLVKAMSLTSQCEGVGIMCEVKAKIFLDGCMQTAKISPGFCESMPTPDNPIAQITWTISTCNEHNHDNKRCPRVVREVLRICYKQLK